MYGVKNQTNPVIPKRVNEVSKPSLIISIVKTWIIDLHEGADVKRWNITACLIIIQINFELIQKYKLADSVVG